MKKLKIYLFTGFLLFSSGIVLLFTPIPNSIQIINIYGKMGISESTQYSEVEAFPMFSTQQVLDIHIYAYNGSFSLIIMDRDDYYKWAENRPYSALYISNNLTYFSKKVSVASLNSFPYLSCAFVVKPEGYLVITGRISIKFSEFHIIQAVSILTLASLILTNSFYVQHKLKIRKKIARETEKCSQLD